ncbi:MULTISPECIES: hypothetical protein [unclassified Marinobacter]|uniref:hypothetical protein n=1 Tax=unclassified Marinobacter TaxID=83889 RepID=UPI001928C44B|nr:MULTISPECIES: hypothetical protein [unclassified Marinobacter]MBL3827016.1 hypothetical protein [Marinobacter sp. MC3]MBL3895449.1 hypothetical protein [Marinobacter sp. MW3]
MSCISFSYIFDLANDHDISLVFGGIQPITDDQFVSFRSSYKNYFDEFQKYVDRLAENSREEIWGYIPPGKKAYITAINSIWYYDRIVVADPVFDILSDANPENIEDRKWMLRDTLQWLYQFRDLIEQGYLILGKGYMPAPKEADVEAVYDELSGIDGLISEVYQSVKVEKTYAGDRNGTLTRFFRVSTDIGFNILYKKVRGPKNKEQFSLFQDMSPSSINELLQEEPRGKAAVERIVKDQLYSLSEMAFISHEQSFSPVLHQISDLRIVQKIFAVDSRSTQNIVPSRVPVMADIPLDRLLDMREQQSNCFQDFRLKVNEIAGSSSLDFAQNKINVYLEGMKKSLEDEMKNLKRKRRADGYVKMALSAATAITGAAAGEHFLALFASLSALYDGGSQVRDYKSGIASLKSSNYGFLLDIDGRAGRVNSNNLSYIKPVVVKGKKVMRPLQ